MARPSDVGLPLKGACQHPEAGPLFCSGSNLGGQCSTLEPELSLALWVLTITLGCSNVLHHALYSAQRQFQAPAVDTRQTMLAQQLEVSVVEQHCSCRRPNSLPEKDDKGEGDEQVPGVGQGCGQPVEYVLRQRLVLDVLCGWLHLGAEEHLSHACRDRMLLIRRMPLAGHIVFADWHASVCWLQALLCCS